MPESGQVNHEFIFNTVDHAIIVYGLDGDVKAWNQAATRLFKYDTSEACGKNVADLIVPREEKLRYNSDFRTWWQSVVGRSKVLPVRDKVGRHFSAMFRFETHDGLFYSYSYENMLPSEVDAGSLLRTLDQAGHLIFVKDPEGRYMEFNHCLERTFGLRRADLLGRRDDEVFPANEAENFQRNDRAAWSSGSVVSVAEHAFVNGRRRTFSITKVVEKLPGRPPRLVCVGHDVTDLVEAQAEVTRMENEKLIERERAALQMSKTKTDFLANMSHEIRTPINAMIGFTTLLRETDLSAEQREYTDAVHRSCGVLLSLINDILDFSKIEAGKVILESSLVDVGALVAELLRDSFNPKRLTLRSSVVPNSNFFIVTDGGRLRQILTVFLSNALKFTFSGGITITAAHDATRAHFHVVDSGIGISQDALKTLFRPFTQVDASTTRRFGGTGLGLSISRSLANLLGGDVDATSQEHVGSDFHLWIPYVEGRPREGAHFAGLCAEPHAMEDVETAEDRTRREGRLNSGDDKGKHFILIVEDSPMNAKLMTRMLEKLGYRAVTATNGLEALNMLRLDPFKYSLTLMDCSMPVMDGYEATREIRKLPSPPGRMPIIALTANVLSDERQRVLDAGMNEYMSKPVFKQTLAEVIERWLPIGADLIARPAAWEQHPSTAVA